MGRLQPVVVLGAGINGAAIARELVLNGIPVCVVDLGDIARGATAYSSRLIHGGLRYLEYGDAALVRESLAERRRLLSLAPQFVSPLRIHVPVETRWSGLRRAATRFLGWREPSRAKQPARGLWVVRSGLRLYDLYARDPSLPRHRVHSLGEPGTPRVDPGRYRWLCSYSDAQIRFPERFVLALLEDARRWSLRADVDFRVLTYHAVDQRGATLVIAAPSQSSPADRWRPGAAEPDSRQRSGQEQAQPERSRVLEVQPSAIVNATGAWVDLTLQRLAVPSRGLIGGTQGSHFVTANAELRACLAGQGVYVEAADGRPVFLLPFGDDTLVGTTDLPFTGDPAEAVASAAELDYLRAAVHRCFPVVRLQRDDIALHYSGVRPLPRATSTTPAAITRRHAVVPHPESSIPLFSIVGGKLTTCRSLAEEAAATVLRALGRDVVATSRDSLVAGAQEYPVDEEALRMEQERLAAQFALTVEQVKTGWALVGTRFREMMTSQPTDRDSPDLGRGEPSATVHGTNVPLALARRIIRDEWVTCLEDLVERRLMLLYDHGLSAATLDHLSRLLVAEGKLAPHAMAHEVKHCRDRLARHFGRAIQ